MKPDPAAGVEAVRLAGQLRRTHGLQGRPTPAERLHVSLNWLGAFSGLEDQTIAKARDAVSKLTERRFRVALNRVASFGGRAGQRPLVLWGDEGVIGVELLHAAIHGALAGAGLVPRRDRAFEPHMTLLWDRSEVPEAFVEPIAWTVGEFALIDSPHGAGRHTVVDRWPLAEP